MQCWVVKIGSPLVIQVCNTKHTHMHRAIMVNNHVCLKKVKRHRHDLPLYTVIIGGHTTVGS